MIKARRFAVLALVLAAAVPEAWALGGRASGPDSGLGAHLVMVLSNERNRHGACTGTAIARDIILTAAHCVAGNKRIAVAYPENGSHVLQRVAAKAIHPGFSPRSRVSIDIALIRLEGQLPARFLPMAIDRGAGGHAVGARRVIAGFGLAVDGLEESAGTLRSARVSVLPRFYPRFMRLGYTPDAGLDDFAVCTGDSGGPVLEDRLVVGVVYGREAFGRAKSCGTTAQAVRVAPQAGWIDGVLGRWGRSAAAP
ncbi:MAG: S1 family peptidase [Hyphomicrobiales bacterium]|uniref:S1 family peptidase n=1 Tax=Rhabdaerophilum calidifontis TaxID=2604328 RepID=UPI00123879BF|nr:S1 family peptidase [Rhabdaerophilum calidifontis]MCA1952666.1 S1 family peptidase [Hyphomicrobiales bacterium]MCA1999395.1 S1 family peptidase [Hyphomicrobiales bacterium]